MSDKVNVGVKNTLAKLMAEENITVLHRNDVPGAKFDMKKRTLILPIWNDMEGFSYNHFIGQEISRALFSIDKSTKGYQDSVNYVDSQNPQVAKSFLEICETARIEKLMLSKYPGLTMDFRNSYQDLMKRGFFGDKLDRVDDMAMGDRANLQMKLGSLISVKMTDEELDILKQIQDAYTWEDTVLATKRLYDYCSDLEQPDQSDGDGDGEESEDESDESKSNSKKKSKNKSKNKSEKKDKKNKSGKSDKSDKSDSDSQDGQDGDGEGDSDESDEDQDDDGQDGDGDGDNESEDGTDGDGEDGDGDGSGEGDGDGEGDGSENGGKTDKHAQGSGGGTGRSKGSSVNKNTKVPPTCNTQHSFEAKATDLIDKNARNISYYDIPKANLSKMIVPFKKVNEIITEFYKSSSHRSAGEKGAQGYAEFRSTNKPYIDFMCMQFNMKKAASGNQRAQVSKTGMIDMQQLTNYLFSEDVFVRNVITPDEKNHGMIMFVDFSGSMSSHMKGTIEQALNTALYCRTLNIPFELYSFGACGERSYHSQAPFDSKGDDLTGHFELRQYFGLGMGQREFHEACINLYTLAQQHGGGGSIPYQENLGGTPLNETLLGSFTIVKNFKEKTKAQIVTVCVISDGDGSAMTCKASGGSNFYADDNILRDPVTKMQWKMTTENQAKLFIEALRYREGVNAVGFYICGGDVASVKQTAVYFSQRYENSKESKSSGFHEKVGKMFLEDHFYSVKGSGYQEYFVIAGGKNISTTGAATADFTETQKLKKKRRVVLGRFVEIMAKESRLQK